MELEVRRSRQAYLTTILAKPRATSEIVSHARWPLACLCSPRGEVAMTRKDPAANRGPDQSDQLSPNRALRESLGASGSQRVGDNGPLANPIVSFREDPVDEPTGGEDRRWPGAGDRI
jgi:hypothetical protein